VTENKNDAAIRRSKNFYDILVFSHFYTIPACDGQRADGIAISALHSLMNTDQCVIKTSVFVLLPVWPVICSLR